MHFFLFLLILVSCSQAPVELSSEAQNIEVLTLKPQGCRAVGKFVGRDETGTKELALNQALNLAAEKGATALVVNQEVPNGSNVVVHTTGYKCD